MRPRRLVVRGFTCFRDEAEIDFTELDLFAITGPTGAGKTSILDAMTLALYGRVYRVEGVRSVISQGVKEMRVYFEFSVGAAIYRVTRVGFAGNRASQVGLDRDLGGGEWEPLAKGARDAEDKITELLGLDFEGFTKAVLLPQNAFFRFLQGEPSERRSILEALLGLEIYERIQKRANHVAEARRQETDLLANQLARDYEDVTPERAQELEAKAVASVGRASQTRAARDATSQALEIARDVTRFRGQAHALAAERVKLATECENLEQQIQAGDRTLADLGRSVAALEREMADVAYDDARHLLLGTVEPHAFRREQILERLAVIEAEAQARRAILKAAREELTSRQNGLVNAQATLADRRRELETAERHAAELETQCGTPATIALVRQAELQARDDWHALEVLDGEISELEARQISLHAEVERMRTAVTEVEATLRKAEAAKSDAEHRASGLRELENSVTALRRQMGEVARGVAKADAALAAKRLAVETAHRGAVEAEQNVDAARSALSSAETMLADLKSENAAYVLRTHLAPGGPCPVCEQRVTNTPELHPQHSLVEAEAAVAGTTGRLRAAEGTVRRTAQALTRAQTELATIETTKAEVEASLERLNREIADLLPAELAGGADKVLELRAELAAVDARVVDIRSAVTRAHTDVARVEGERRGLPDLATKRKAHTTLQTRYQAAAERVKGICGKPPSDEAAEELAGIAARLAEAESAKTVAANAVPLAATAAHELELACQRLAQRVAGEEQAVRAAAEESQRLRHEQQQAEEALARAKVVASGNVLAGIRSELRRLTDAKRARDGLLAKRTELLAERGRVQEEAATLRGRCAERMQQRDAVAGKVRLAQEETTEAWTRLANTVRTNQWPGWDKAAAGTEEAWLTTIAAQAQRDHESAVAEHTAVTTQARALVARLELANACRTRHAEAEREANVAGELGQLLMANHFRSYLLEEAIRTLAADGSRHLKELSGGRYTFYTEGAEFQIVDSWNADERRSVKTLSGGETFLASLALALGLAEGLPTLGAGEHGHQRLESLFIDEGFGTLDPDETLDIVTQALENLRTSDRIVGIVTHLPQLAERLPAQIRVVKTQTGSHIEVPAE